MVYSITRKSQSWYGESIGILILDAAYPCVPGNVGNATSYPFPVRYHEVEGASIDRLLNQCDPTLAGPFIAGALELQARGVKAVTGACGFMAIFQPQVAAALDIPVFLSPLLQIPFIAQITGSARGRHNRQCRAPDARAFRGLRGGRRSAARTSQGWKTAPNSAAPSSRRKAPSTAA